MTWALVLGGAANVFEDADRAISIFGQPDLVVGVKDIWITYPTMHHVVTFHIDRIPFELEKRQKLGYANPLAFWTYNGVRCPRMRIEIKTLKVRGGSSGLLGALVGKTVADKAILAGIPLDPNMPHFHSRRRNKPWAEAKHYRHHWNNYIKELKGNVMSMSGYTKELLGEPTPEWMSYGHRPSSAVHDTAPSKAATSEADHQGSAGKVRCANMDGLQQPQNAAAPS